MVLWLLVHISLMKPSLYAIKPLSIRADFIKSCSFGCPKSLLTHIPLLSKLSKPYSIIREMTLSQEGLKVHIGRTYFFVVFLVEGFFFVAVFFLVAAFFLVAVFFFDAAFFFDVAFFLGA